MSQYLNSLPKYMKRAGLTSLKNTQYQRKIAAQQVNSLSKKIETV
ncbi:hypothetical protein B712_0430 [Chlamydia psittaci NJ1]|nr:hypothetical protein B712_0430 [Chlamydia psittaci NJ1]